MFESLSDCKRALVFGTGGGNDIVSAFLAALYLQRQGIHTDVAGILSPAAHHTFDGNPEKAVNELKGDIKRYIPSKRPVEISFIDQVLPEVVRNAGCPVGHFYDFSLRFGTQALVKGLEQLVSDNDYDLVVAVDVGGDILGRPRDKTLLSPIMDFASLYAVSQLGVDTLLVEFGLGTDGELRPYGMREILRELRDNKLLLHESSIHKDDSEVAVFRDVFEGIAGIRRGHTATMTLQTLDTMTPDQDIVSDYRSTYRIGRRKWFNNFPITLLHDTFGKAYTIDAKLFAQIRPDTAFPYSNPLEQYLKLKTVPQWKTELDLHHLWSGDDWTTPGMQGDCLLLLCPPATLPCDMRNDIIRTGLAYMREGNCDAVLLLESDSVFAVNSGIPYRFADRFVLVSENNLDLVESIREYQK